MRTRIYCVSYGSWCSTDPYQHHDGNKKCQQIDSRESLSQHLLLYDLPPAFNLYYDNNVFIHGVWKSQKKSHSTLRAKRATFTFWVDKSWLKMPKMVHFGEFLKTWSLRSNSVTRQVSFNRTKISGTCQNSKIQRRQLE